MPAAVSVHAVPLDLEPEDSAATLAEMSVEEIDCPSPIGISQRLLRSKFFLHHRDKP